MTFVLSGLMLYTMWAIFGLMFIDFLISFFRSLSSSSFPLTHFLTVLKDVVQYVFPLLLMIALMPLDPSGWIMLIAYYLGGLAVIWHYLMSIKNRF